MKDIIETASKYFKHVLDAFHDVGEPNKECETKSFDMLDTHLDILGLIPPLQGFKHDYLKMLINIKQGYDLIESKEKHDSEPSLIEVISTSKASKPKASKHKGKEHHVHEVNRYYESALADFVASVPLFAWSGPFARAMRLEKDEVLDEGPMTKLKEAILEAVVKDGGDLMSVTKPLEQMMGRFGNAITYANAEAVSWVDRVSNQTIEDSDNDKINIDEIANSMFEVLIRFGCTDYKEMKEINKAINGVLPTIEMDGKEKEGTFAQKMFVHLIRTIDELLRYAGFAHFEPLQVYVGIGLPDCLEKCYELMNSTESKANAKKPQKFAMSKDMDQVQTCISKAATALYRCAVRLENGPEETTDTTEGENGAMQQQRRRRRRMLAKSRSKQVAEKSYSFLEVMDGPKTILDKMSEIEACEFEMPDANAEENFVDRPWKVIQKLHKRTKWEIEHFSCQYSEEQFDLINPREIIQKHEEATRKSKSCNATCSSPGQVSNSKTNSTTNTQNQETKDLEQQQALLEITFDRRKDTNTFIELQERIRCGCKPTNGFDLPKAKLPLSASQYDPLGTTPKLDKDDLNMPSGEDIVRQANEQNDLRIGQGMVGGNIGMLRVN